MENVWSENAGFAATYMGAAPIPRKRPEALIIYCYLSIIFYKVLGTYKVSSATVTFLVFTRMAI